MPCSVSQQCPAIPRHFTATRGVGNSSGSRRQVASAKGARIETPKATRRVGGCHKAQDLGSYTLRLCSFLIEISIVEDRFLPVGKSCLH